MTTNVRFCLSLYFMTVQVESFFNMKHNVITDGVMTLRANNQGPVVQSVVSLTSSLRVISLTVLADSIHNILIFFAEKM